jgi:two-component system, LuxR family, response regulator FixJ
VNRRLKRGPLADNRTLKALIVEANGPLRAAVGTMMKDRGGFLTREAADGLSALRTFKAERPDAVIFDLKLPDRDGIETMREMSKIDPTVPIIILTDRRDIPAAVEAIKCGAYDLIEKPPNLKKLLPMVRQAIASPSRCRANVLTDGYKTLTPREREILFWTVEGKSSMEIAGLLSISHRTVESHRENIFHKLGMRNKAELIRFAVFHGIVPVEVR